MEVRKLGREARVCYHKRTEVCTVIGSASVFTVGWMSFRYSMQSVPVRMKNPVAEVQYGTL